MSKPAMWQARVVGSTTHPDHGWREVSTTKHERTVDKRVAYLRTLLRADGSKVYEFRSLWADVVVSELERRASFEADRAGRLEDALQAANERIQAERFAQRDKFLRMPMWPRVFFAIKGVLP